MFGESQAGFNPLHWITAAFLIFGRILMDFVMILRGYFLTACAKVTLRRGALAVGRTAAAAEE